MGGFILGCRGLRFECGFRVVISTIQDDGWNVQIYFFKPCACSNFCKPRCEISAACVPLPRASGCTVCTVIMDASDLLRDASADSPCGPSKLHLLFCHACGHTLSSLLISIASEEVQSFPIERQETRSAYFFLMKPPLAES